MRTTHWLLAAACAASLVAAQPTPGYAQFGGLKKSAEEAAKRKAAEAVRKASEDSARQAAASQPAPAGAAPAPAGGAAPAKADPKVWENYDFVPGNRVIFYTDFTEDRVGNFARGLKYRSGAMDVVDRDGVKMLRATSRSEFLIPLGAKLPERFTLELDVLTPATELTGYDVFAFEGGGALDRSEASAEVNFATGGTLIIGGGQNAGTSDARIPGAMQGALLGQVAHIRMLMDGAYFKLYVNERRMYNIPELGFKRDSVIRVFMRGSEDASQAVFITRVRVAESETDVLYDALAAKGRWATQGILFATGKADVQPESRPVLKEIATTLQQHPELRILIEGHTDNVGSAASNLTLSDARAAAVKAALVKDFGIAGDRITTKGLGDTKPAVPNATSAGRAQNRRVEVVKL
jgi:outer membrane protein OmpA-like peptidoglycan-associated protein